MSQENVDLVRWAFAEFGSTPDGPEKAARSGLIAPDVEIDFSAMYPDGPIIRGLEASLAYVGSLPWGGSLKVKAERFFDVDDERVMVFVHATAKGEGSEVPVEMRDAHEFTIRDGVFVRWKLYADRAEALEAAGLRGLGGCSYSRD
jgi:ketosteroid isomerase-like protein